MDRSEWAEWGLDFDVREGVAWITLNRPEVRNAVHVPLRQALLAAIEEVRDDPAIRAAVVTGAGTAFCSGADLSGRDPIEIDAERRRGTHTNVAREDGLRFGWWRVIEAIWTNEKPFVAAVNGPAFGFGVTYALGCDLVLCSSSATFGEVFVNRGLPLEAGGAYLFSHNLTHVRAKELAMFGEPLPASVLLEWGMVNRVVAPEELIPLATEWAGKLAKGPTVGIGHVKYQINNSMEQTRHQSYRDEVTLLGIGAGLDGQEAMTAFRERRAPQYKGL